MLPTSNTMTRFIFIIQIVIHMSIVTKGEVILSIKTAPQFPHPADKSFDMKISSSIVNETIDDSVGDLMLVLITDAFGKSLENAVFDYGLKDKIDSRFKGQFIRIPTWQIGNDRKTINLSIWFTKLSNKKILEIYKINASSKKIRQQILNNLKLGKMIYRSKIEISVSPKLKISVNGIDPNRNVFTIGEVVIATCRITEATTKRIPVFSNLEVFTVKASSSNTERNEREVMILVSISDHRKNLICSDGNTKVLKNFNVFHHPTAVTVNPEVRGEVNNDSIFECNYKDGYPTPTVRWHFIDGPTNETKGYKISPSGTHLHIKIDKMSNIRWRFNCSVKHRFLNSTKILHKTISFVVKKKIEDSISMMEKQIAQLSSKCDLTIKRMKDMEKYQINQTKKTDERVSMVEYTVKQINQTNRNLTNEFSKLLKQINEIKVSIEKRIGLLDRKKDSKYETIPIRVGYIWKIRNFKDVLRRAQLGVVMQIFSAPFYSHTNGYQMCLSSYPAGQNGTDRYLGIYFHIMKGEFDDLLSWPMKYEIQIGLINQNTGQSYVIETKKYESAEKEYRYLFNQPISNMNTGFGTSKYFIPEKVMEIPFLYRNDEIHLKCTVIV